VAVKIKLKRIGKMREPHYRIVVADARTARGGRAIEEIGQYHPLEDPREFRSTLTAPSTGSGLARSRPRLSPQSCA
jgi:ribosomal protein S16